jgi:dUTP pyrophosphatase
MEKLRIHIKRLTNDQPLSLPQYMTEGSSGMDLFASLKKEVTLQPGERGLISTGISVAIPEGFEGQVRPRIGGKSAFSSSISAKNLSPSVMVTESPNW